MKHSIIKLIPLFVGMIVFLNSCRDDLLDQPSRTEMPADAFWKSINDAEYALNGTVADIRYLFDRDYYLDAMGEFVNVSGSTMQGTASQTLNNAYKNGAAYDGFYELYPTGYGGTFSNMYRFCYGGVNRCCYIIEGIENMIQKESNETNIKKLEALLAEAKLFRSLVYLRLISMWGDTPYISERIYKKEEVEHIFRTPIEAIKDSLISDLTYATIKLPDKADKQGRMAKPAAYALRGKVHLYWASWNKFGWPELNFEKNESEALISYKAATADFKRVINDFGLELFRGGEPGECDELGKADKLPNYYYLFTPLANGNSEFILAFNHGGTGTGQGERIIRDFAGRSLGYGQCWLNPRFSIADRYQSTVTGDFCEPLLNIKPNNGGRTATNSALNPQSYVDRDYRMKASMLWDFEMCMGLSTAGETTDYTVFIYKMNNGDTITINDKIYNTYETDRCKTGYVFRKFVRNYSGGSRDEGDFSWPAIRLADVYLMFAEAVNFGNVTEEKDLAVEMVNKVRRRGNLPALSSDKTATADAFFAAIEQERIVELVAEGHRSFDLRRWRKIEDAFAPPFNEDGYSNHDTYGDPVTGYSSNGIFFQNQPNLQYERCYIFQIPESERIKNPNLTQNKPFL